MTNKFKVINKKIVVTFLSLNEKFTFFKALIFLFIPRLLAKAW